MNKSKKQSYKQKWLREGKKCILQAIVDCLKDLSCCKNFQELAGVLKMSPKEIENLRSASKSGKKSIAKLIDSVISHSLKMSYKPIAELQPIKMDEKGCMLMGKTKKDNEKYKKDLETQGIYLFYDSLGKSIYAGKTSKQPLWKEMNSAFFRDRPAQTIYKSYGVKKIKKQHYYLSEAACYFSAYQVHKDAIKDYEALIIRTFPNDLTNVKMENKSLSFDNKDKRSKKGGEK